MGTILTKHRPTSDEIKGHGGESEKTSFLANWRHTSEILLRHLSIIGLKHIITLERAFGIVRLDDVVHVQFSKK